MNSKQVVFSHLLSSLCKHLGASVVSNLQKLKNIILLILFIIPLVGCALSTEVTSDFGTETDSSNSSINSIQNLQYKIAVVADSNEDKFAKCVERGLRRILRKSIVISEEKFRDEIYPHTQLCDRPSSAVHVYELLSNPNVHLKLLDIELDFIVYVGGSTNWKDRGGYITPPALPLPLWFGYTQKERKTSIRTAILDINKSGLLGNAFVRSKGIVAIPIAVLWLPIPLGLGTESSACSKTAQHIADSLVRRSLYTQNVDDAEEQSQLTNIDSTPTASDQVNRGYIDELKRSADEDNAEDQFTLGRMYHNGNRVEQDYREALKWFKKASENENADAQYYLGAMYYEGRGVSQDYAEAEKWYRKAAEQGNAEAAFMISELYFWGFGVSKDKREAARWCLEAANLGHGSAACAMGQRYSEIIGPQSYWGSKIEEYKWLWVCIQRGDILESERTPASFKLDHLASQFSVGTLEYANIVAKEWRPHSSPVVSDYKQAISSSCNEIAGNYVGTATDNCTGRNITSNQVVDVNSECTFVAKSTSGSTTITTNGSLTARNGNNYQGRATNNAGCGSFDMNCSVNLPSVTCNYTFSNGASGTISLTRK